MPSVHTQKSSMIFSNSISASRRNFTKLLLIFLASIALLSIPLFIFLPVYVQKVGEAANEIDASAVYLFIYVIKASLFQFGLNMAVACVIGIFTAPLFMGMAGKIVSDDLKGIKCSIKDAFAWTRENYKKLLTAYASYYLLIAAYGLISGGIWLWLTYYASNVISAIWTAPVQDIILIGAAGILLGTMFIPFIVLDEKKSGLKALGQSFKTMYSKNFSNTFLTLLPPILIAVAFTFLIQLAYSWHFLFLDPNETLYQNFLNYLMVINNDIFLIIISIVVYSLAGVFLFIFAYNTYRQANNTYRRTFNNNNNNNNGNTTYRRKINVVQTANRRRVG